MQSKRQIANSKIMEKKEMKTKLLLLVSVVMMDLTLTACHSVSEDVSSLNVTPKTESDTEILNVEVLMKAFADCLRDEGMMIADPQVDSDGNIKLHQLVQGETASREERGAAFEKCGRLIEGLTLGQESKDRTDLFDNLHTVATCLSEKGYAVGEFILETVDQWQADFRATFDWDDTDALADYQECSSD